MQAGGGTGSTDIITMISQLIFTIVFLMMFLGVNQRIQVALWARDVRGKLAILRSYVDDAISRAVEYLRSAGVRDPHSLVSRVSRYFIVHPVDIEPVDIIRRLERVLRTKDETIRSWVLDALPPEKRGDETLVNNVETLVGIAGALDTLYRLVRHLFILSLRYNNWALMMQLVLVMPMLLRVARSYRDAAQVVSEGRPIGDGAGPLAAFLLAKKLGVSPEGEAAHNTVYYRAVLDEREVYIIKAKGPGSTVGRPGEAVENIAKRVGDKLAAIITIDAVLKLEGEETGEVAIGAGVAMGDPGPEKIKIERIASRLRIPLHAIGIKMSIEEAITGMRKEIADAASRAAKIVEDIVKSVERGKAVIVVGVGNTVGIGQ
ncbi:protein of unknown function DUF1512 [Pyrolobus fumarii 1A]|uniref:DUF1512 domain-containing protein n=1 Tax=Pyrolobus fumarii (strain DSM 11204 / 1A) TaxID=694429 RepID=G0EEB5_PYRF1|nr:DUF1512 domain-containing protein [Pyrolobus fumarii]AEM38809.1 protein of unknown function DUF1512 [Pyrolobus fumarii 1A]